MILLDAVAAWHMRANGLVPTDWIMRLRRVEEGDSQHPQWRQLEDAPPASPWFQRLTLIVPEGDIAYVQFDPIQIGEMRYMQADPSGKGPKGAALMMSDIFPDAIVDALPGRPIRTLVDLPPIAAEQIIEAKKVQIMNRTFILVGFQTKYEAHAMPSFLSEG